MQLKNGEGRRAPTTMVVIGVLAAIACTLAAALVYLIYGALGPSFSLVQQ